MQSYTCRVFTQSGFLLLALLLIAAPLRSQHRSLRFQHITTEDGLAQNMVDCMLQDSQGFLWFGTWNGLCRYDGYTFEVFGSDPASPNFLGNNFIHSLQEDPYGNIWIGTKEGLYAYLYEQERFVRAEQPGQESSVSLKSTIPALARQQDSLLLVGSEQGLSRYRLQGNSGKLVAAGHYAFGPGEAELSGSVVNTILTDRKNNIWVGTDEGITFLSADGSETKRITHQPENANSLSSDRILSMYEAFNGDIWIGTEFGLNRYVPESGNMYLENIHSGSIHSGTFQRFHTDPTNPASLIHNTVMDILEDNDGNLIVATLGGLSIKPRGREQFTNYKNQYHAQHSLSNNFINCLLKDEEGNVWIGTERGGINYFNTNQNTFEHFEFNINEENSLSQGAVNSVYEDSLFLWIGTAGGGLNRYDKTTGTFHHFKHDPDNDQSISSDFITSIHRDQQGRLWIGTWGSGLNRLVNEHTDHPYFSKYHASNSPGIVSNFISSVVEDSSGNLWIGTLDGLVHYDAREEQFTTKFADHRPARITGVGCLLFDTDHRLWVGTRNGLFHIQFPHSPSPSPQIIKYQHDPANPHSLSGNYVISVLQDSDGNHWFGTYGQGINRLHTAGDSVWFTSYTTADGLSNNIVYGIQQDQKKQLWLSTDFGLSRLNPETKQIRNFHVADGLLNNQYYWSASYQNDEGKLYFGGMNGLDSFHPEWVREVVQRPRVVITDVKLLNESVVPGQEYHGVEVLRKNASQADEVFLSYQEKIFGIEFSSLNYQEPGLIRYAYILEGFDKDWNHVAADRRYASYTNLTPGEYIFKVKASGSHGEFMAEPTEIVLHIAPPFWSTTWFRILVVLLAVGIILGYIRFRTYKLKYQKLVLERQVKERTDRINQQKDALAHQAVQLLNSNRELEEKQSLIEGQNLTLEHQNKEILSQRDELIHLNKKLKLVSQLKLSFFTNISHEFRTPLTLILGPLEKLIKENNLNPETHYTLSVINRNAQRLMHLINQIMDFRKIEKGRMELKVSRADLPEFCGNVFRAFEPLAELKEIQFIYRESSVPTDVWFDAPKLENIVYNLLSNAFKYTPNGGKVVFEVKGISYQESRIKHTTTDHNSHKTVISMKVKDSGVGISQENVSLVFKRFYRIESEEAFKISGSGIGLALTEELIKTHHGDIFVDSKLGEGSTFEIQFPCLKDFCETEGEIKNAPAGLNIHQQVELLKNEFLLTDDATQTPERDYIHDPARPTILVVEDNLDLRKFITHRLAETYNLLEAGDGEAGRRLAETHNPDLIISDVMMPKMNGLELCAALKENLGTCHIPIILLTAKNTVENQIEGLELGADDYVSKPFNFDLLEARAHNLISTRNTLRQHFLRETDISVSQITTNTKDQQFLEQAIETVEQHLDDPDFGVQTLVRSLGISRSLLHKKLSALTSQSATEFINHLRMKRACQLLQQQQLNISEVAYAVGFNDPKYFSRLFGRQFGQSPTEFLRKASPVD